MATVVHYPRAEKTIMNWDMIEGNWKQLKGKVKNKWGNMTDSDIDSLCGKKDQLVGKIQERYGCTKEDAERQADEWSRTHHEETVHSR